MFRFIFHLLRASSIYTPIQHLAHLLTDFFSSFINRTSRQAVVGMAGRPTRNQRKQEEPMDEESGKSGSSSSSLILHNIDPHQAYDELQSASDGEESLESYEEKRTFAAENVCPGPSTSRGKPRAHETPYDRKPVLDKARHQAGIDPAEASVRKHGVTTEQLYQYMVARAAKDDEHHAVMRNILAIVKRMEDAWTPTKSSGRAGAFQSFFHH